MSAKNLKNKRKIKTRILGITTIAIFALGAILAVAGMSNTIGKFKDDVVSRTPDAILASAEVDDGEEIALPIAYFDQRADHCVNLYDTTKSDVLKKRQFEWTSCGYYHKELEQGLIGYHLNDSYQPTAVATSGKLISNRGLADIDRWFKTVDGKSQSYTGALKLGYSGSDTRFYYENNNFYPLDEAKFSADDLVNQDGHNHLFTMTFAVPFSVLKSGNESFEITADDDTFVFIGKDLVLDMGGIHDALTGSFTIQENGEIYAAIGDQDFAYSGINLADSDSSIVRVFHADRDSDSSVFKIAFEGMDLNIVNTKFAGTDEGIQIAYGSADPSFIAPLGETSVVSPSNTKGYVIMATIFGVVIMALSVLIATFARHLLKNKA